MKKLFILLAFLFVIILIIVNFAMYSGIMDNFSFELGNYDNKIKRLKKSQVTLLEELNLLKEKEYIMEYKISKIKNNWIDSKGQVEVLKINSILEDIAKKSNLKLEFSSQLKFKKIDNDITVGEISIKSIGQSKDFVSFVQNVSNHSPLFYLDKIKIYQYNRKNTNSFMMTGKIKLISVYGETAKRILEVAK